MKQFVQDLELESKIQSIEWRQNSIPKNMKFEKVPAGEKIMGTGFSE